MNDGTENTFDDGLIHTILIPLIALIYMVFINPAVSHKLGQDNNL